MKITRDVPIMETILTLMNEIKIIFKCQVNCYLIDKELQSLSDSTRKAYIDGLELNFLTTSTHHHKIDPVFKTIHIEKHFKTSVEDKGFYVIPIKIGPVNLLIFECKKQE